MNLASFITVMIFSSFSVATFATTPNEYVEKADLHRGLQNSFSVFANVEVNDGKEVQKSRFSVKVLNKETSLVEQVEPERARGRKLLMQGLDMWLFTKDIKRPVRIGLEQKLVGEVSNGDLSRTNYAGDYEAKIVGEEKIDGADCVKLELTANNKKVTYGKIDYFVGKTDFKPRKAYFYALSGKKLKTAFFKDFKKIYGEERMTSFEIFDEINKTKKSIVRYDGHKPAKFNSAQFNKESLESE